MAKHHSKNRCNSCCAGDYDFRRIRRRFLKHHKGAVAALFFLSLLQMICAFVFFMKDILQENQTYGVIAHVVLFYASAISCALSLRAMYLWYFFMHIFLSWLVGVLFITAQFLIREVSDQWVVDLKEIMVSKDVSYDSAFGIEMINGIHVLFPMLTMLIYFCYIRGEFKRQRGAKYYKNQTKKKKHRKNASSTEEDEYEGVEAAPVRTTNQNSKSQSMFGTSQAWAEEIDDDDPETIAKLKQEVCLVCNVNIKDTAMEPCGHYATCSECAVKLRHRRGKCPVCRRPVESNVHVFQDD